MTEKKLVLLIFILNIICANLSSCTKNSSSNIDLTDNVTYEITAVLSDSIICLEHGEEFVCPYDNILYAAGNGFLTAYDLSDDMRCTVLAEIDMTDFFPSWDSNPNHRLIASADGLALLCTDRILFYDLNGNYQKEIAIPQFSVQDGRELRFFCASFFLSGNRYYVWSRLAWPVSESRVEETYVFLQIDPADGTVRELKRSGEAVERIYSILSAEKGKSLTVAAEVRVPGSDSYECQLVKYDLSSERFETVCRWNGRGTGNLRMLYDPSLEGAFAVMLETRLIRLAKWSEEASDRETLRQIPLSKVYDEIEAATGERWLNGISEIYWTGTEFLLKASGQPLLLTFEAETQNADTLTILYPDRSPGTGQLILFDNPIAEKINYATLLFEAEHDVGVKTILYPKRDFNQRLRMKMLAGDRDFDIVYEQDGAEMLNPLLRNNLYLPLENDAEIVDNFRRNYMDGVEAIMTADGHIWGIPYHVVSSALAYEETGIGLDTDRILREGWTEDEYWAAVDASGEPVTNIALHILLNHADDALLTGHFDRNRIVHTFTEMKKRADAGKLWNDNRETNLMDMTIPVQETDPSGQYEMNPDTNGKVLLPLPGTPYAGVSSYIFGYRDTEHPDAAYAYLRFLSGDYWVTLVETQKTYLAKNTSQYHQYFEGLTRSASEEDTLVNMSRNAFGLAEKSAELLPLYRGSRTGLMDSDGYLAISTIIDRVWDGKVTPEQGADDFISKIGVRLFE